MNSIERRLQGLQHAIERQTTETVIGITLITVQTRAEVLALERLRENEPPATSPASARGLVRLEIVRSTTAREVLAEAGVVVPAETQTSSLQESENDNDVD